ncbi:Trehalose synthase/amylase TreS [bacterium YEK0313]|nr:Trehalose synthase/amylase TreS [bacterium YEK0313]
MKGRNHRRHPNFSSDPLWYKDAAIYQLHVKSFFDSNNDGIGDFPGLIEKLDYIAELGVNTIWLLPFYPSPRLDDGYDISAYLAVHPDYGTLADVRRFIAEAHARGLRVITELVINHTSDQHPWFQRARRAKPGSNYRDFYVWSDNDKKYADARIIFVDTERSNWTWDTEARAYYWHRFYSHQPDLNFENPNVFRAILRVMKFWLDMQVDGLRLDAVPYLIEQEGTSCENLPGTHDVLKRLRAALDERYPDRMLLAEANQWPEDTKDYFGDGDECHMAFHFPLMPRMYMALAREDRFPITDIMRQTPDIPANCQWAIFLRNHDELTLEMVTDSERDYLWQAYASDRRARLNLGIRRRLAPLLDRDRRRIELMTSLLFSMPGTPVIYYGDELGIGDNIHLGDRDGVRTPMQWSPDRNGGFSRADPAALVLPPIMDPLYGFDSVNVEAQSRDAHSLLNWVRRTLGVRRQHKAFGRGNLKFFYPTNRKVLAYLRQYEDETILCVANLARTPQAVELDLSELAGRLPIEMTGGSVFPPIGELTYLLTLPPYGFYWFLLATEAQWPSWHTPAPEPMPETETLVLRGSLAEALEGPAGERLREAILPVYLAKRRWYSGKSDKVGRVAFRTIAALPGAARETLLIEITAGPNPENRWFLPMTIAWEDEVHAALPTQLGLVRVRRGRRVGMLTDAFAMPDFAHDLIAGLSAGAHMPVADGEIRFLASPLLAAAAPAPGTEVQWIAAEQSNSSLIVGDTVVLKIIRSLFRGRHPEPEMTRCLTDRAFANTAPLLGEVVHVRGDEEPTTIAIAQGFVRNQGDAWAWTLEQAARAADEYGLGDDSARADDALAASVALAGTIGTRLGAMHVALAAPTEDQAFAPRHAQAADVAACAARVTAGFDRALHRLAEAQLAAADAETARSVAARADATRRTIERLAQGLDGALLCRIHGDFHLGQVLVANGDAYIIDFEGEPQRSLDERRAKASPLRDVAGLLRSLDYAAEMVTQRAETGVAPANAQQRDLLLARFRARASSAFLDSYRAAAASLPLGDQQALLDLFLIEKAAYEIAYEAANRPAWIHVPLRGLAAVLDTVVETEAVDG